MTNKYGYSVLEANKEEIINLYNSEGWGRVKIADKYGVNGNQVRIFLKKLKDYGLLNSEAIQKHRYLAGHNGHKNNNKPQPEKVYNKEKRDSSWAYEHSKEIIQYFKDGHTKGATMRYFDIDTYGLSRAAFRENTPEAGYPSMLNKISGGKFYPHEESSPYIEIEATTEQILSAIKLAIDARDENKKIKIDLKSALIEIENLKQKVDEQCQTIDKLQKELFEAEKKNERLLEAQTAPWRIKINKEIMQQARE